MHKQVSMIHKKNNQKLIIKANRKIIIQIFKTTNLFNLFKKKKRKKRKRKKKDKTAGTIKLNINQRAIPV